MYDSLSGWGWQSQRSQESHSDKFLIKLPPPIMMIVFKERGNFYKAFTHYKLREPLYWHKCKLDPNIYYLPTSPCSLSLYFHLKLNRVLYANVCKGH